MKRFLSLFCAALVFVLLFAGCGGKKLSKRALANVTCGDLSSDVWLSFSSMKLDEEKNCLLVEGESYYKYTFDRKNGLISVTYVGKNGTETPEETVKYEVISDDAIKVDYGEGLSWTPTISERETNADKTLLILSFSEVLRFNGERKFVPMSCLNLSSMRESPEDSHCFLIDPAK